MDVRNLLPPQIPAFYSRYKTQLPIIGTLIVFATFMAHDHFRENAKDLADSIQRANEEFQVRQEIRTQDTVLGRILNLVEPLNESLLPSNAIKKTEEDKKSIAFYRLFLDPEEIRLGSDELLLKSVKDLHNRLPPDAKEDADLERLSTDLRARRATVNSLHGELYPNTFLDESRVAVLIGCLQDQRVSMTVSPLSKPGNYEVPLAMDFLRTDVVTRAEYWSKIQEGTSSCWRTASIWLYLTGFILGLGGKLFGVEVGDTIG